MRDGLQSSDGQTLKPSFGGPNPSTTSAFRVLTNTDYEDLSPASIQEILRTQNIVVPDSAGVDASFDLKGLGTVADVDQVSELQGISYISIPCNWFFIGIARHDSSRR